MECRSTWTRLYGAISQKAAAFIISAVNTWTVTPLKKNASPSVDICISSYWSTHAVTHTHTHALSDSHAFTSWKSWRKPKKTSGMMFVILVENETRDVLNCKQQCANFYIGTVLWLRRLVAGFSLWSPGSHTGQSMWDLWRTNWQWDRVFSEYLYRVSPYSYIIWVMNNNRLVGGRSSETSSHPID
jgi:hypothetical protein